MTEETSHPFILDFGKMDINELESKHLLSHLNKNLELHNLILQELNNRKFIHIYLDVLDREQEWLIQDWKTYDASKMSDQVLLDDNRIVSAWLVTLKTGKRFESPQFKDLSLEEQIKIVLDLELQIHAEMKRRGFKVNLWHWVTSPSGGHYQVPDPGDIGEPPMTPSIRGPRGIVHPHVNIPKIHPGHEVVPPGEVSIWEPRPIGNPSERKKIPRKKRKNLPYEIGSDNDDNELDSIPPQIESLTEHSFVFHRHYGDQIKSHFDLRWKITNTHKQEMNIYKDPTRARVGEKIFARYKNIVDEDPKILAMWMVTEGDHLLRRIGPLETYIDCLDSGTLDIIGFSDNFISMKINGKFLKGYFVARKDKNGWSFTRTNTAMKEPLLSSETINDSDSDRHD